MGTNHNPRASDGPPPSAIQTRPRAVHITSQEVQPNIRLYLQDEDTLQFAVLANFNGAQVVFQLRYLLPDGQIIPTVLIVAAPTAGVFGQVIVPVTEGFLLTASIRSNDPPLNNGQWVYGVITLFRGGIQGQTSFDSLLSGYCSSHFTPSWPEWPPQRPTDGLGTPVSVAVANPAAGADFTVTVPTGRRWQVISVRGILSTSVAVANRFPGIVIDDGANQLLISRVNTAEVASASVGFTAMAAVQPYNDTQNNFLLPLPPPTFLQGGFRIKSSTLNLQAADQWTNIQLLVNEWADIL